MPSQHTPQSPGVVGAGEVSMDKNSADGGSCERKGGGVVPENTSNPHNMITFKPIELQKRDASHFAFEPDALSYQDTSFFNVNIDAQTNSLHES